MLVPNSAEFHFREIGKIVYLFGDEGVFFIFGNKKEFFLPAGATKKGGVVI